MKKIKIKAKDIATFFWALPGYFIGLVIVENTVGRHCWQGILIPIGVALCFCIMAEFIMKRIEIVWG